MRNLLSNKLFLVPRERKVQRTHGFDFRLVHCVVCFPCDWLKCLLFLTSFNKNCSNKLFFNLEKASNYHKGHKASHRHYGEDNHDNTQASRRTTYRINMPVKVAKLILPQIRNKNQETIIRIYPDKRNEAQNQTGSNYLLSLSYKKLNDEGPQNQVFKDPCPGGCCCCPGSE